MVGSTQANSGSVCVATRRLNTVIQVEHNSVISDSGVVLSNLNSVLESSRRMIPLDLGSSGSCTIGGNVATNAGGIRYFRYGSMRSNVLGLEVVLPSGEVCNLLKTLPKDNTGYDLKQLFIGSEGTLGIITKVAMKTVPVLQSTNVSVLAVPSFTKLEDIINHSQNILGEILSACEFWDKGAYEFLLESTIPIKNPFDAETIRRSEYYILLETKGSNKVHDIEKLEHLHDTLFEQKLVNDGVLAKDEKEINELWKIRENFTVALRERGGHTFKHDLSLPKISLLDDTTQLVKKTLNSKYSTSDVKTFQYGHILDGNLHLEVWCKEYSEEIGNLVEDLAFGFVTENGGSISAEHGIGILKKAKLHLSKEPNIIKKMKQVKKVFDPNGIINPGKIFD